MYKLWANEASIKIELALTYIYKLNRGAKCARQETITKLIKIYIKAGFLKDLWLEITFAAVFLYNKSLFYIYNIYLLNKVFNI